jgi:3-dehydroquinate synthase
MREIAQDFTLRFSYPVIFTRGVFEASDPTLRDLLRRAGPERHRVLPVVDAGVLEKTPDLPARLEGYADAHRDVIQLVDAPLKVRGGEVCKNDPREVEEIHERVERHGLCRHSFVLAIGGGSVLDAVGFATTTAHRGLRLIRMPTTVLAQNDAGIGVKNAINWHGRKNFLGTFAAPFAVINDYQWLDTLSPRDRRAGIAEAVKVALIRDRAFFEWLHRERGALVRSEPAATEAMIERCAEIHLAHIRDGGDPFEQGSARPLDFGHWSAHKLEELSGGGLRHGEAVAVGIAIDALYSEQAGLLPERDLKTLLTTLEDLGFDLRPALLSQLDIARALDEFRQHLGGRPCITLLDGIGHGVEVDDLDLERLAKCVEILLGTGGRAPGLG